uniref:Uncharacterized protein n=1 Tax=Ixodes ricinus TaxID=34613 RepID=V5IJV8_IXORI
MAVLLRRSALYRAFNLNKSLRLSCANISTTKKNKEVPSTTISDTGVSKPPVTVADFADTKPRYWMTLWLLGNRLHHGQGLPPNFRYNSFFR